MIVLEVKLNGKVVATAGRNDLCVLNTIVDAVGVLGAESIGTAREKEGFELSMHVGGLSAKTEEEQGRHLRWIPRQSINVGDEVSIRVLEAEEADPPVLERQASKEYEEETKRKSWESAREFYFKFRDEYEADNG